MRVSVTTATTVVAAGLDDIADDTRARGFLVVCPAHTGIVYFENSADGAPSTADGCPIDFSRIDAVPFTLEPGEIMNARSSSGSVELRVLRVGR